MKILFGHPTGNPNSHHAALAHFEAGRLEAFCVSWMPSLTTLRILERIAPLRSMSQRLKRRNFHSLETAPKIQGRAREFRRLLTRALGRGDEGLSYEANDWLMRTMRRECQRPNVTAVHSYEDCSLWQFEEAKHLGKACIYDMPIGYYPAWEQTQAALVKQYVDWLPEAGLPSSRYVRPVQKRMEMEQADLVLVPSSFVANTIREYHPYKVMAIAPYGVDAHAWGLSGMMQRQPKDEFTFLFVGQCSLRKGVPLLLEAWRVADFKNARLLLIGHWQLAEEKRKNLPIRVTWMGPVSQEQLRAYYHQTDMFVFPTYFEGRALVIGEALAAGLPVLSTPACGYEDLLDDTCGKLIPTGNFEALVEGLRWFDNHRDNLVTLSRGAVVKAKLCTWEIYRRCVTDAVRPFV